MICNYFLLDEIESLGIEKYKSIENIEEEKERRKNLLLERKRKRMTTKVKYLRKRTLIEDKMKIRIHKHNFVNKNGVSKCETM